MSSEIFSSEIIGKVAMTNGGYPVGAIVDVVFDTATGEMKYLLVNAPSIPKDSYDLDERGRVIISFSNIKITEKNVVFSK